MTSDLHLRYAEEVAALSGARLPSLHRALATVRRESFLPPGPWQIEALNGTYYASEDADPRHVLHAVGVAIDGGRMLNNANPVRFAEQMPQVDPQPGESVFHVGAGLGYFTALLAEMVGPSGRVLAAEIDPQLRDQARINLHDKPWVSLVDDALNHVPPPIDILYSSAGLGTLPLAWLNAMRPGGRMVAPITDAHHHGLIFLLHKIAEDWPWAVRMMSFTRHYPCLGTREDEDLAAISTAFTKGVPSKVSSLRIDPHDEEESCWLHGEGWCLSMKEPMT